MRSLVFIGLICLTGVALAVEEDSVSLGLDLALPYTALVDGNKTTGRGNFNLGVDSRYYVRENVNLGLRLAFDVERQTGSARQFSLVPGVQFLFLAGERFSPYFRLDLPVLLRGARSGPGSENLRDLGMGGGMGLAWNLGERWGTGELALRCDFSLQYFFGLGQALSVLQLELIKLGLEYRF